MSKGDLKIQRNSLSKLKNVSLIKGINDVYSGCTCSLIMEYNYILSSVPKPCLHPDTVWLRLWRTYNLQNEWPSLQSPVLSVSAEVRRMFVEEPPSWQGYHCYWQTIDRHVGTDSHRLLSRLLLPSFLLRMRMYKPSVPWTSGDQSSETAEGLVSLSSAKHRSCSSLPHLPQPTEDITKLLHFTVLLNNCVSHLITISLAFLL